jgi:hypothetical protein
MLHGARGSNLNTQGRGRTYENRWGEIRNRGLNDGDREETCSKPTEQSWAWWLMPVIPANQEAEDHSSKPAPANSLQDPISKKTHHKKRAGGVAQGVGPEFKSK